MQKVNLKKHGALLCAFLAVAAAAVLRLPKFRSLCSDHSSILPKLKSAKSSTRSVRLGATGAAFSASRGA